MAKRFLNKKTHRFFFINEAGVRKSYVLIFGDEVETLAGDAPSKSAAEPDWIKVKYRKREGEMKGPVLSNQRSLEMYFLDVGQGDAAFIVTPNNTKILIDGGLKDRALGFLVWKYRLDKPNTKVTIDHLILSHGDADHVKGLPRILDHNKIAVKNIYHNGIAIFTNGTFNTELGEKNASNELTTLHDQVTELDGLSLSQTFQKWIGSVKTSLANYRAISADTGVIDVGDPRIKIEVLGPRLQPGGNSLKWFSDKAHTINGHSVVFMMTYDKVRTFFSGDLNIKGSKHLLEPANAEDKFDAHVFKSPHHGSHEYKQQMFDVISPQISVVSSGDSPDHGHPRALFLGGLGLSGRTKSPLIFSTEIASTFIDAGDQAAVDGANIIEPTTLGDLDFSTSDANEIARRRFKKILPGIINVRTDGEEMFAHRRVNAGYQWESYGGIKPMDKPD